MLVEQQKQEQNGLLSQDENNPLYYKNIENKLLLSFGDNNAEIRRRDALLILSFFGSNITSRQTLDGAIFFLKNGAGTARDLQTIGIPEATAYRMIKNLRSLGFIEPYTKLTFRGKRGGPRPVLYAINGATAKEITQAADRYLRQSSRSYVFVDQVYQLTLNHIEDQGIQYRKIFNVAKSAGCRGFKYQDVADIVAQRHQQEGIKVWL